MFVAVYVIDDPHYWVRDLHRSNDFEAASTIYDVEYVDYADSCGRGLFHREMRFNATLLPAPAVH